MTLRKLFSNVKKINTPYSPYRISSSNKEKEFHWKIIKEYIPMYIIKTIMYCCGTIICVIGSLGSIACVGMLYDYGDYKNIGTRMACGVICIILAIVFAIFTFTILDNWSNRKD